MSHKNKEIQTLQLSAIMDGARLSERLRLTREQQSVLEKCGLKAEAKKLDKEISSLVRAIDNKITEAQMQRRALIREMLLCFAAGDIATTCADRMGDTFGELSFGRDQDGGKSLAKLFRMQADDWNKCVQMVDGMSGNERVSFLYADMAEEIVAAVVPVMQGIVDKYMASEKGERYL